MSEVVEGAPAQGGEAAPAASSGVGASAGGATAVSDEVVEKIAGTAARQVPGVADLGGDVARFFNSVLDRIGLDEVGDAGRGVSAKVDGTKAVVNVVIVLKAGHVVTEVTEAVRVAVEAAVEKFGLEVTEVNVKVDDVELGGTPAPAA